MRKDDEDKLPNMTDSRKVIEVEQYEEIECVHCDKITEIKMGLLADNMYNKCDNCDEVLGYSFEETDNPQVVVSQDH